jgi:starch synthase
MNAMRYGVLPIVRATGGLSDTVKDGFNGFVYTGSSSFDLERSLKRAVKVYETDKEEFQKLIQRAMNTDNSWNASAASYHSVYQSLMTGDVSSIKYLRPVLNS